MKIKICGLKYEENIQQLLALQPDYLGFIFYEKSPRFVGKNNEVPWLKNITGPFKKVGVFVNTPVREMIHTAELTGLHIIQLHGDESPEICHELKQIGLEIWKAFSVDEDFDFNVPEDYGGLCSHFLFDTKGKNHGGNGVRFNWNLLEKYTGNTPTILSGGIGPEDAAAVNQFSRSVKTVKFLSALDLNSRFETEPGWKDMERIKKFKHELCK